MGKVLNERWMETIEEGICGDKGCFSKGKGQDLGICNQSDDGVFRRNMSKIA